MKGLRRPGKWKCYSRFYNVGIMQYQNILEYMNHAGQACQAQTFVGKLGHKQNCPYPACMQQPKPGGPNNAYRYFTTTMRVKALFSWHENRRTWDVRSPVVRLSAAADQETLPVNTSPSLPQSCSKLCQTKSDIYSDIPIYRTLSELDTNRRIDESTNRIPSKSLHHFAWSVTSVTVVTVSQNRANLALDSAEVDLEHYMQTRSSRSSKSRVPSPLKAFHQDSISTSLQLGQDHSQSIAAVCVSKVWRRLSCSPQSHLCHCPGWHSVILSQFPSRQSAVSHRS